MWREVEAFDENCRLCVAVRDEKHLSYFTSDNEMGDGDWFYILKPTKMKGHKIRYMVVNRFHGKPMVPQDGINLLFQWMLQFKTDFTMMEPTHATIPDHWHLMACDLGNSNATDTYQIADTDRIEVRFMKRVGQSLSRSP